MDLDIIVNPYGEAIMIKYDTLNNIKLIIDYEKFNDYLYSINWNIYYIQEINIISHVMKNSKVVSVNLHVDRYYRKSLKKCPEFPTF